MTPFETQMLEIAKKKEANEKQTQIIAGIIVIPLLALGLFIFFGILSTM